MRIFRWAVVAAVVSAAISAAIYFWGVSKNHESTFSTIKVDSAPSVPTAESESGTEKRTPASPPSPQEQYRRALEEDEMKRTPTWEEMRKEAPAEF